MARRSDNEVMELLGSDSPLNKARAVFSGRAAKLEQAEMQKFPPSIMEIRRMEFEAVEAILAVLGLELK